MIPNEAEPVIDGTAVPSPPALPGMHTSLIRSARQVAHHAAALLDATHALLLTMTIDTRDECAPLRIGVWDRRFHLAPLRTRKNSDVALLEAAARVLLTDLIQRWPSNAVPPAVGIFTDGGGVAFSSDHPSPLSSNWLAHHQAGLCPTTALLPFRPGGAWSRLIAPVNAAGLH